MRNPKTLLRASLIGTVIVALCCFTPILVVLLGAVGLAALTGYLDYVLLPALAIFIGLPSTLYGARNSTTPVAIARLIRRQNRESLL